jgi:fatty-acyl-CoA synthase
MRDMLESGTIISRFAENARRFPSKNFVHVEIPEAIESITYARAWSDIQECAEHLESVAPGGVVLVFMPQGWPAIAYFFGAMLRGLIPSFMPLPSEKQDPGVYWPAHRRLFEERLHPAALITEAPHAVQMANNGLILPGVEVIIATMRDRRPAKPGHTWPQPTRDSVALLQHSSGTTGLKKGVALSHAAVIDQVESCSAAISATADDVIVSWLPLYHDMGLVGCLLLPAIVGQTIVLLDPFRWVVRPNTLFDAITKYRGAFCWLPNFAFEHLVRLVSPGRSAIDLTSMRAFINCSEPCRPETFDKFLKKFGEFGVSAKKLHVSYGMAELTFAVTQTKSGTVATRLWVDAVSLRNGMVQISDSGSGTIELLSAGPPINGASVAILSEGGGCLPEGTVGEISVRASYMFSGYYNLSELTYQSLVDGTYRTNDRGFMHCGEIYVLGRIDDLIILNGRNFHAAEIEAILNSRTELKPGRNVAFGVYNAERGMTELVLVAEMSGSCDVEAAHRDIREAVFESLGIYPSDIMLVELGWLLKTTSGKIARGANAEKYLETRSRLSDGV